jgi:hypothetical protein
LVSASLALVIAPGATNVADVDSEFGVGFVSHLHVRTWVARWISLPTAI